MYKKKYINNTLSTISIFVVTFMVGMLNFQVYAQVGTVKSEQKISSTSGGLVGPLDNTDNFATSVANIGDVDGDGISDIAVGAWQDDDGGTSNGAVYIINLNANGTVKSEQKISDTNGGLSASLDNSDYFGWSVASLGDFDGDTIPDIAVGAYRDDDGGQDRGAIYILTLNANGTVKTEQKISSTNGGFTGSLNNSDLFGSSITSIGDIDSDGVTDIAVGAIGDEGNGGSFVGAVYILNLNANGTVKSAQKVTSSIGGLTETLDDNSLFGSGLTSIGDLDGDSVVDIAVGSYGIQNSQGGVFILNLNTNGTVKSEQKISSGNGGLTGPLNNNDQFGWSVSTINDINGDGITDIIIGARNDDDGGSDKGAVYILALNTNGTVQEQYKISDTVGGLTSSLDSADRFGTSVTSFGDLDGDLMPDVAVGASFDDDGGLSRGAVYILNLNGTPPPGISFTETSNSTVVTEDGQTDTIEYVLDSQPSSDVTITFETNSDLNFGSGDGVSHTLIFTTTNWDTPQTLTITAVDDDLIEGPHTANIEHTITSTDGDYNGFLFPDIPAQITDNDVATLTVTPETIIVPEDNGVNTFNIVLGAEPNNNVVIDVTSQDTNEATVSPSSLTFTNANWDIPQTVTVNGVDDVIENDDTVQISIAVNDGSSDDNFDGLTGQVEVTLTDNDQDGDGDGVPDQIETDDNTDPSDPLDYIDTDNDLVPDYIEDIQGTDENNSEDFLDSDNGGTPDYVEKIYYPNFGIDSTDENDIQDDQRDFDQDTLSDYLELVNGSQPTNNDDDGDGILTSEELTYNNGDANGDGQLDYNQSNVTTILNPFINEEVTLDVNGDCAAISQFTFVDEEQLESLDDTSNYGSGLHSFTLSCSNPGQTATVEVIWPSLPNDIETVYKKFNGAEYIDITDLVEYDKIMIQGQEKIKVSYEITDGGALDADGLINGTINDPAGPATLVGELIRTGGVYIK